VLLLKIERPQQQGKNVVVRAYAAFAKPELYEALVRCRPSSATEQGTDYAAANS